MTWSMRNACTAPCLIEFVELWGISYAASKRKTRSEGPTLYEGPREAEYFLLRSCAPKCPRISPETSGGSPEASKSEGLGAPKN